MAREHGTPGEAILFFLLNGHNKVIFYQQFTKMKYKTYLVLFLVHSRSQNAERSDFYMAREHGTPGAAILFFPLNGHNKVIFYQQFTKMKYKTYWVLFLVHSRSQNAERRDFYMAREHGTPGAVILFLIMTCVLLDLIFHIIYVQFKLCLALVVFCIVQQPVMLEVIE